MSEYTFHLCNGHEWHHALETLYKQHYAEMQTRLKSEGIPIGDYAPRTDVYFQAMDSGNMLTFIVIESRTVVGYSNVWLTNDMHNGELIAQEDTIYMLPEHRNGTGRKFSRFVLDHLKGLGVKRMHITATTDTRVGKIFKRIGFRDTAQAMTYVFDEAA